MPEPKREEDKIFSFDSPREGREDGSVSIPIDAGASIDPAAESEGSSSAVAGELNKLRTEKDELMQTLVRRQADFENFRKRTERDRQEESRRGVERLVIDLFPILDGFDRALQAHDDPNYEEYRKGINLIRKQLFDVLTRHGVQRIDAAGKMFDPHLHQAIERVESSEFPDGQIAHVFQDGFLFNGRVLRPAIVRVAVNSDEAANGPTS